MPLSLSGTTGIVTGNIAASNITTATIADANVTPGKLSQPMTLATAQNATGTAVDFTGIPSWVKRITVMLNGVSTNGTSPLRFQIGGSSIESSGYNGCSVRTATSGTIGTTSFSSGFDFFNVGSATLNYFGNCTISIMGSNTWSITGMLALPSANNDFNAITGTKQTSSSLSIVRITTVSGTDTFDAGTINIMYEG
jgi:hypothetical protein